MERLFVYRILSEIFSHVSSLKDEQKEVVVHLLRSQDVVTILLSTFGKVLIYPPFATAKKMQMERMLLFSLKSIIKEQIEEMEEIGIPSIVLST